MCADRLTARLLLAKFPSKQKFFTRLVQNKFEDEIMKALVYKGPGKMALEEHPKPVIAAATDAVVRMLKTTI